MKARRVGRVCQVCLALNPSRDHRLRRISCPCRWNPFCRGLQNLTAFSEMLKPSSAIMGAGLGKDVALITDGRFSGGSHGFLIGHIVPEAQEGGPIGLIRDGDEITIDAETRRLDVSVGEEELSRRRKEWKTPAMKYEKGTLKKYAK